MSIANVSPANSPAAGLANLSIFDRITDPKETAKQLGAAICESKVFGCQNAAQGEVLAWECLVLRIPPLRLAQTYHLIMGKLTMRADAMLAGLVERGGSYLVKSRTPDAAAIEIDYHGQKQTFSLTWEEAKKEPFAYEEQDGKVVEMWAAGDPKKQPTLKTKYSTPRARMQMLWARVVSDGVRTMAPEVNSGRYTPEEFDGGDVIEGVATPIVEVPAITAEQAIQQAEAAYAASQPAPAITHAESTATTLADKAPPATPEPTHAPASGHGAPEVDQPGFATRLQRMEIDRLWAACMIPPVAPEGQPSAAAILRANYKVESSRSLSQEQAAKLIGNLTKKAAEMKAARDQQAAVPVRPIDLLSVRMTREQQAAAAAKMVEEANRLKRTLTEDEQFAVAQKVIVESRAKGSSRETLEALPATEEQIAELRGLVRSTEQFSPGMGDKITKRLSEAGLTKFAELSQWSICRLIDAVAMDQLKAFFDDSIANWKPTNAAG
jgi:hypothetical protein